LTGLLLWHWRSLGGMVAACNAGGLQKGIDKPATMTWRA